MKNKEKPIDKLVDAPIKRLIDGERLDDLLHKLEEFRCNEHLTIGEFEFLTKVTAEQMRKCGDKMVSVQAQIAKTVEELKKRNGTTPTIT